MGRTTLTQKTSWSSSYEKVTFTAGALDIAASEGDAPLAPLAASVEALVSSHAALSDEQRTKRRAIQRSHARVRRRDFDADLLVTELHNEVIGVVKGNKIEELYRVLFPKGRAAITKLAAEDARGGVARREEEARLSSRSCRACESSGTTWARRRPKR